MMLNILAYLAGVATGMAIVFFLFARSAEKEQAVSLGLEAQPPEPKEKNQ